MRTRPGSTPRRQGRVAGPRRGERVSHERCNRHLNRNAMHVHSGAGGSCNELCRRKCSQIAQDKDRPEIDIKAFRALARKHGLATGQLQYRRAEAGNTFAVSQWAPSGAVLFVIGTLALTMVGDEFAFTNGLRATPRIPAREGGARRVGRYQNWLHR